VNLIIDIGNTRTKIAIVDYKDFKFSTSFFTHDLKKSFNSIIAEYNNITNGIVSSVIDLDPKIIQQFKETCDFIFFDENTPIPIKNKYTSPETLGKDRLAAAVGAWSNFKHTDLLIIDSGTCLKIDIVNAKHEYLGGMISPGFNMRFQALHEFTGKLPLINEFPQATELTGKTTTTSILSGVINGMNFEISGFINQYLKNYPELKIITTGGAINFFELEPKNRIFARPDLILEGLNEIVLFNAKK
jgi:type III pantothenate kinase